MVLGFDPHQSFTYSLIAIDILSRYSTGNKINPIKTFIFKKSCFCSGHYS